MKHPLIRTIYLYLFTLIGLVLIIIGTVRLVNLGLKMFIFTQADQQIDYEKRPPVVSLYPSGKEVEEEDLIAAIEKCEEKCELTVEQKTLMANWLQDYKTWQENEKKIDYLASRRQQEASQSVAFMIVGLPVYLYHWFIIRKEVKKQNS